jgi:hypothetical protein
MRLTSKALYEESTVLTLGAKGAFDGEKFELVGRSCLRGESGALWNEWAMRFDKGKTRWLAEARGEFVVYAEDESIFGSIEALVVDVPIGFIVVERGEATRVATWGDVPDLAKRHRFADIVGPGGWPVSIDWSGGGPRMYAGTKTTLEELVLTARKGHRRLPPAPDVARPKSVTTWLDVGDEGTLAGRGRFRVAGILGRSIKIDGEKFTWVEYFLDSTVEGFRWLSESDGHWSFVTPIDPVRARAELGKPKVEGYSSGTARIDWAAGELPWAVEIGETVEVSDSLGPTFMVSREASDDEVSYSLVEWLPPEAIAKGFSKRSLPKPVGRAPHQPRKR